MSKQRRTFSAEFKREAAALVLDQGHSHIEVCMNASIHLQNNKPRSGRGFSSISESSGSTRNHHVGVPYWSRTSI
jgi:hypothetical protein